MPSSPPLPTRRRPRFTAHRPGGEAAGVRRWRGSVEAIQHHYAILWALWRFGYLRNAQVRRLAFDGEVLPDGRVRSAWSAKEAANESLRRLKDLGLVAPLQVRNTNPETGKDFTDGINYLTKRGLTELRLQAARRGSDQAFALRAGLKRLEGKKLSHALEIRDTAVALQVACRGQGWELACWLDDAQLQSAYLRRLTSLANIPDGFLVVQAGERRCPLFLEADRGWQKLRDEQLRPVDANRAWAGRLRLYGEYFRLRYRSDPFWRRLGCDPGAMEPPLVLTVTRDPARVEAMLAVTRQVGGRGTYWYTSRPELLASPGAVLEDIWRVTISDQHRRLRDHLLGAAGRA